MGKENLEYTFSLLMFWILDARVNFGSILLGMSSHRCFFCSHLGTKMALVFYTKRDLHLTVHASQLCRD